MCKLIVERKICTAGRSELGEEKLTLDARLFQRFLGLDLSAAPHKPDALLYRVRKVGQCTCPYVPYVLSEWLVITRQIQAKSLLLVQDEVHSNTG